MFTQTWWSTICWLWETFKKINNNCFCYFIAKLPYCVYFQDVCPFGRMLTSKKNAYFLVVRLFFSSDVEAMSCCIFFHTFLCTFIREVKLINWNWKQLPKKFNKNLISINLNALRSGFNSKLVVINRAVIHRGVTRGSRGGQFPGRRITTGAQKFPTMSQVLSSIQYICFLKTSNSNMAVPN